MAIATPVYWFIIAPYKSLPFGSGDRHLRFKALSGSQIEFSLRIQTPEKIRRIDGRNIPSPGHTVDGAEIPNNHLGCINPYN